VNSLETMDLEFLITRNRNRTHPATWSSAVQALRSFLRDETIAFRQMLGFVVRWVVHTLDDLLQHRVFLFMVCFCLHRCSTWHVPPLQCQQRSKWILMVWILQRSQVRQSLLYSLWCNSSSFIRDFVRDKSQVSSLPLFGDRDFSIFNLLH